ncbi:hypothetical protein PAECIP111802_07411 [Paenibacillus allorhizosphaerae]|uniref:Transposase IS110-like N-terminal domain-containing protein n=1 Tax=Paenibacillus allorhizosphaerae TaxID=2849866 RepID=A0ABN7U168_9BACL|nr:hypothetical protein PAECIP111802_07411 [Paenibacillus allorhizosphaerae]
MKFKAQDKQNQLIENITSIHLVVGVDIAQETHVARAVSYRGIALGSPIDFGNHDDGFRLFGRWIHDLLKSYKLSKVIVGMEPTGHYWLALAQWLQGKGIEAVRVNHHLVKKNKEHRDNTPSKATARMPLLLQIWSKTDTTPLFGSFRKPTRSYGYSWRIGIPLPNG